MTIGTVKESLGLQKETLGLQKETLKGINGISTKFDILDTKFGSIGSNMEKILLEFKEERKENREFMERLINAVIGK